MTTHKIDLRSAALALMLPLAFAACGDDGPTGPDGGQGRVSAELTDASSSSAHAARASSASSYQGHFSGNAQVQIYSEARGWVSLGAPSRASFRMQSNDEATVHSEASVPTGSYTKVRLVLEGCDAAIDAGAVFGGLILNASVKVRIGGSDGRVEIEKEMQPFTVTASTTTTIRFDLNSEVWMDRETAESETATDSEVESATSADIEQQ